MLTWAVIVFALAAVGGLVLASHLFRGQFPPWALSIGHALLGALGLVLLIAAVLGGAASPANWALIILVVAALGGFFLASFHLRGALPARALVAVHALVAVVGFLVLLRAAGII